MRPTSYFSFSFLSRWCIVIGVALAATIVFLTLYRESIESKFVDTYGRLSKIDTSKDIVDDFIPAAKKEHSKSGEGEEKIRKVGAIEVPDDRRRDGSMKKSEEETMADGKKNEESNDEMNEHKIEVESFAETNCPKWYDDRINVHFILHTHDDPGWLKTPEQYYKEDVYHIFNSFIRELLMEPQRRFVYSESYYFTKWWLTLNESMRNIVRRLITNGQLEFVGGGWVQNDDATTHYSAMIDQLTYGWAKIDDYFGQHALPKTGWNIDCFGYSQEQAAVFDQMGMYEDVIVRLHHKDIARRRKSKEMEFMWQTSPRSDLFTHVLYDHYIAPNGYNFEFAMQDTITKSNEKEKVDGFLRVVKNRSDAYQTNQLLMIMGHDFVFKSADIWDSVDRLIRGGNFKQLNGSNIQLFYSTPSCYFKALRESSKSRNVTWPKYDGDFFPYATSQGSYWTGYFSSRANLKRVIRMANNILLTAQNLAASVNLRQVDQYLNLSREALYVTYHHDGITGTCKQAVADEYLRLALRSIEYSRKVVNLVLPKLVANKEQPVFEFCLLSNVSICNISQENDEVSLVIMNGFSQERSSFIRIPIDNTANYELTDSDSKKIEYQVFPVTDEVGQFKMNGRSSAELGFFAELPALGFATYRMKERQGDRAKVEHAGKTDLPSIENEFYKIDVDRNGYVAYITDKKNGGKRQRLVQDFFWYTNRDSGAYMLRPTAINRVANTTVKIEWIDKGPLVQEIRQTFDTWVTQHVRLYKDKPYVEFEWSVGPLEPENLGKEVITRFYTDMKTKELFYTDANGRRVIKRKRDPQDANHPIAASYHPITTMVAMRDESSELSLITDRSMAASSVMNGSLELILYRKVLYDDGAGMGEGMDERDENKRAIVTRGKIWLTLNPLNKADTMWRRLAKEMFYEPVVAYSKDVLSKWPNRISMLREPLPDTVHLLTLQTMGEGKCLIRFEHFIAEDGATTVTFPFQKRFRGLDVSHCNHTQLGGWNRNRVGRSGQTTAVFRPMDIVTFKCACKSTMHFEERPHIDNVTSSSSPDLRTSIRV